jgi:phasin family protein
MEVAMLYANDQLLGMYRAGSQSTAGFANILLSSVERLLSRQASISREVLDEYAEAAKQMGAAADLRELLSIQARLAHSQIERSMAQWTDFYAEIGARQKELLRVSRESTFNLVEGLGRTLEGVTPPPGTEPVMSVMRLVVDATRSSYAAPATGTTPPVVQERRAAAKATADKPTADKEAGKQAVG